MKQTVLTIIMILSIAIPFSSEAQKSVVVLELFTSQGCSSCPSADQLLKEVDIAPENNEVIALSYHVDYWNYIGWKDPFSKAEFTEKQRQYGSKFFSSSIYTPQVVVNGKEHFVGSNRNKMNASLKKYKSIDNENTVKITNVSKESALITFDYEIEGKLDKKWLSILLVIKEKTTEVKRGENRNRVLKNVNIVVNEASLELISSGKGSIIIPDSVSLNDELALIVLTQKSNLDITGGSQILLR